MSISPDSFNLFCRMIFFLRRHTLWVLPNLTYGVVNLMLS